MSSPGAFSEFARQGGLAGDGRCKAFSDDADGTGWAEGAGILVVERLSDARRNNHPVLAVVRGSAVNQDGASNGLTAPNGLSQQRVILAALANAGLPAAEIDAVEAHGTGTALGDPIEAQALLATYGQGRPADRPLLLGSAKSNLGHTQAAAGVVGVIKSVLALRHGVLPPPCTPNGPPPTSTGTPATSGSSPRHTTGRRPTTRAASASPPSACPAPTPTSSSSRPRSRRPRRPTRPPPRSRERPSPPCPGSCPPVTGSPCAPRPAAWPTTSPPGRTPTPTTWPPRSSRPAPPTRTAPRSWAPTGPNSAPGVEALARGEVAADVFTDTAQGPGKVAFLFSGQGAQRAGMGRELYEAFPVFAETFDTVCAHVGAELKDVVFSGDAERLGRTEWTQPALFAVEVALFRLLESWGVRPDFVGGHSIGEIAAAHVAGVLSLEDACTLVTARGRLMQALPEGGVMVAVEAAEDEVLPLLEGRTGEVSVAAVNGPRAVVLAGVEAAVTEIAEELAAQGRRTSRLRVSHAFHSPLMEPMLAEFREVAESLTYAAPAIPVVSDVTGRLAAEGELTTPTTGSATSARPSVSPTV